MRPGLDELRERHDLADPYGVPTGAVPRVVTSGYIQVLPEKRPEGIALTDALADVSAATRQAVDDYIQMEHKAKAWDALYAKAMRDWDQRLLEAMDSAVSARRP